MTPPAPECSGDLEPERHNDHVSPDGSRSWCDHCELEFVQGVFPVDQQLAALANDVQGSYNQNRNNIAGLDLRSTQLFGLWTVTWGQRTQVY